jgi:hypothetical protein
MPYAPEWTLFILSPSPDTAAGVGLPTGDTAAEIAGAV